MTLFLILLYTIVAILAIVVLVSELISPMKHNPPNEATGG